MEYPCLQLNDLPDEILLIIFKKLTNVEVLYSLIDVNKRLNKIVHDSIFTRCLTFLAYVSNKSIYPLFDPILDRFCLDILPKISHKIKRLNLESSSMERILRATNYLSLNELGLYNIERETTVSLFTDETSLLDIIKDQTLSFAIDIIPDTKERNSRQDLITLIFSKIFTKFVNIQNLYFGPFNISYHNHPLVFDIPPLSAFSSTLLKLHVNVRYYEDCFWLLDGRFNQLHTLYVTISCSRSVIPRIKINNKLTNLKCFSLTVNDMADEYDEIIVPLLQRMSNLEKLVLYLFICRSNGFIDCNELKRNVINSMPQIKEFSFNIRTITPMDSQICLPSNDKIQHTFKDFQNNEIISYIDYFQPSKTSQFHIYSQPYQWKKYEDIRNNFPGGLFKCVREVSLFDERPFQHEFFLQIAQSFPLLTKLTLSNDKSQNDKQFNNSKNDNKHLLIIKYPHLTDLDLSQAHDDYIEQFLVDTKTYLPTNVHLRIYYESLQRVTQNFTRNATRINYDKFGYIKFFREFKYS